MEAQIMLINIQKNVGTGLDTQIMRSFNAGIIITRKRIKDLQAIA